VRVENPVLLLEEVCGEPPRLIWIKKQHSEGQCIVALRRGMTNNDTNKKFLMNNKYTFDIASTVTTWISQLSDPEYGWQTP
jgi:hypothetical protein